MAGYGYKRGYKKRGYRKTYRKRISPTKKLVTGQTQPTLLEKIASGVGAAAGVAKAVLPMISAINTENKYLDVSSSATLPFNTPAIVLLSNTGTGTSEQDRIGNSILARNVNIRFSYTPNFTSVAFQLYRVILFVDKQQAGTAPTAAQLFQTPSNLDTPFNKNFTDRFAILKDKRFNIAQQGSQTMSVQKWFRKLEFHIRYVGTSSASASMGNNSLYLLLWSNAVTNPPTYNLYSRLNFTDN